MPNVSRSILRPRADFRTLLSAAAADAKNESAWSRTVCETAWATMPDALGLGVQFFEHSSDLRITAARHHGVGVVSSLSAHDMLAFAQAVPVALLAQLYRAPSAAVMLSRGFINTPDDGGVKGVGVVVCYPRPGQALVLTLKLSRTHELSSNEQRILGTLRLFLEAGAAALNTEAFVSALSPDAQLLEGRLDGDGLWRALSSGRHRVLARGVGPSRHFSVVENDALTRVRRRLTEGETTVLELTARGVTGKEQSWELGLSQSTISRMLATACSKLGFVYTSDAIRFLGGLLRQPAIALDHAALTSSELDVLSLLRLGLSNREIALRRQRSPRTVANQVAALLRKTGAPGRRALFPVPIVEH